MRNVIDQSCDPGFANLRIVVDRFPAIREFAKTANMESGEFEKLSADSFAWPAERRFPIHTPQHTAISVGYCKLAGELPREVIAQLGKAADAHGISPEVFEYSPTEKIASAPADYLLPERQRFKVTSAEDIPLVEEAYRMKFAQLNVEDRAEAGMRLVKLAEQHGVSLHPSTQKLAGFTMTSTQALKDWMGARAEAARRGQSPLAQAFDKMAEAYTGVEPFISNRDDQLKLAGAIHTLDKAAGITHHYGKKLPTPIETVFNTNLVRKDFVKVSSALANKAMLQQLPLSFWEDALGPDVAKEIAPDGVVNPEMLEQIIPTLPADIKVALEAQLAAYNR